MSKKEINLSIKPSKFPDEQFFGFSYGNEDRIEGIDMTNFDCPKKLAKFLRGLADNIESYENSKKYRSSDKSIFHGLELPEEFDEIEWRFE